MSGIKGSNCRACQTTTRSGITCQKWSETTPHSHNRNAENYPDKGLGDHKYCRNPDEEDTIWCYTTDSSIMWEYCDPIEENIDDSTA